MVEQFLKNRAALRQTFKFIGEAHKGVYRSRDNGDGQPRSYDHHPMEVALLFAEMEIFNRRCNKKDLCSEQAADKIIEIAKRAAHMSKRQLKNRIYELSKRMNHEQMSILIGLLCHDTIEMAYKKDDSDHKKQQISALKVAQIKALWDGAEDVALVMTNSRNYKNKKQKRDHQVKLARKRKYARLKMYDVIANMADQMLIPNRVRSRKKKRTQLWHMRKFMRVAQRHKNIPFCYYLASERIYKDAKAQLG